MKMTGLDWFALILVIIGGLTWGLLGVFGWNLVEVIFGGSPVLVRLIYILVGLASLYELGTLNRSR